MADAATPAEGATPDATTTTVAVVEETHELGDAGKQALDQERKARRDAEKRLKTLETEHQKLRDANLNEVDKAILAAKNEGRTEALREAGVRLVEAEVRAAAAGRGVDVDALLEGVDRSYFLDDEGNPDRAAIQAWIDKLAPAEQERGDGFKVPDLGQGARNTASQGSALALGSDPLTQTLKDKLGIR